MKHRDLTKDEEDEILEVFDQTDPKLQRSILAAFVARKAEMDIECERLRDALKRIAEHIHSKTDCKHQWAYECSQFVRDIARSALEER